MVVSKRSKLKGLGLTAKPAPQTAIACSSNNTNIHMHECVVSADPVKRCRGLSNTCHLWSMLCTAETCKSFGTWWFCMLTLATPNSLADIHRSYLLSYSSNVIEPDQPFNVEDKIWDTFHTTRYFLCCAALCCLIIVRTFSAVHIIEKFVMITLVPAENTYTCEILDLIENQRSSIVTNIHNLHLVC